MADMLIRLETRAPHMPNFAPLDICNITGTMGEMKFPSQCSEESSTLSIQCFRFQHITYFVSKLQECFKATGIEKSRLNFGLLTPL